MRKKSASIDGFVPRYPGRSVGDIHKTSLGAFDSKTTIDQKSETDRPLRTPSQIEAERTVSRAEVDASLREIENEDDQPKKRRGFLRRRTAAKPYSRRRKIIKRIVLGLLILLVLAGAYLGIRAFINGTSIFRGNIFDIFQNKPLKMDENGRTNILIYGTSGSIEDQRHDGANLTDTLMVLSINQKKKDAYMFSLPRDFYVDYGAACLAGYQGKINAMYECYTNGKTDEKSDVAGAKALQKKMKEITGLSMHYYAHINWAVVLSAINAVGGVDVNVEGNGSCAAYGMPDGSIVDNNMQIRLKPGKRHMNGDQALRFSRARGSSGGCGLDRGDFDRQINQQKVLKALQEKAVSAGTLTNIGKVTSLMDALGQNLRTDFEISEVRTLMSLGGDISSNEIISIDLVSSENQLIVSGNIAGAGSIQVPRAGTYNYTEIKAFLNKKLNANTITKEDAHVALFNASGIEGYATKQSEKLQKQGFNITAVGNAPTGTYKNVEIYDLTKKKPATKKKLQSIYDVEVRTGASPIPVTGDTDFVVIFAQRSSAD